MPAPTSSSTDTAKEARIASFRDDHFGMFIHWGPYSTRGIEASWPLFRGTVPWAEYEAMADVFDPQGYDPVQWATLAKDAGARYMVLTTKHHDGYALWNTQLSDYSSVHRKAGRDLVTPYVEACRAAGLKVGFYFSLCDWHHPDYPFELSNDRRHRRAESSYTPGSPRTIAEDPARWERYLAFMHGQVRELLTNFGQINLLWFDGHWEHTPEEWKTAELEAMIHELQPGCVINNRIGSDEYADYVTPEQHVPVTPPDYAWETCLTINETWAYNGADRAYKSSIELIASLAEITSKGGNLLLNVGPTPEGTIPPEFASRWQVIAEWMAKNGESILDAGPGLAPGQFYGPSTGANDGSAIYLFLLGPVNGDVVRVRGMDRKVVGASILASGSGQPLEMDHHGGHLEGGLLRVTVPSQAIDPTITVVKLHLADER
jgi:alpha-L-fucosidase